MPQNDLAELDRTDRILLGSCAGIWLAALGAGVAATVALVDLGTHTRNTGDTGTPWLLYAVIAVSAAVIAGAVPLLLRARRAAVAETPSAERPHVAASAPARPAAPAPAGEPATEKIAVAAPAARDASAPAVERLWLRASVGLLGAMGVATFAIGVGTYLMAVHSDTGAWVLLGLAGVVTLALPVIPWFFLRELRSLDGD